MSAAISTLAANVLEAFVLFGIAFVSAQFLRLTPLPPPLLAPAPEPVTAEPDPGAALKPGATAGRSGPSSRWPGSARRG
jgi:hypothetical protein